MRSAFLKVSALLLLGTLPLACGGGFTVPQAGDSCTTDGSSYCETSSKLLRCEHGQFRAIACKGTGGCKEVGINISCDWTSVVSAGDACPYDQEGKGACSTSEPKQLLQCTGGTMVIFKTCSNSCGAVGAQLGCS
jgi:hypothetical protein